VRRLTERRSARSYLDDEVAFPVDKPLTILVVDDVVETCRMYRKYFEHAGAGVVTAHDGAEAIRIVQVMHPDAVLLDIEMPRLTGWEVLASLHGDARMQDVPVVVLTGHATDADRQRALREGAADFLAKPCLPHEVLRTILKVWHARTDSAGI
jgi:CheY-like chemotaxis protein